MPAMALPCTLALPPHPAAAPRYCRYQSSCRYKAVVTPSLQAASLQGGCRYTSLHVTGYVVTDPRYRRNWPRYRSPSLHRRYRLHRYRGPSLHIVTPYKPCRYTARRYTLYGRGYVSRSCWIGMGHIGIVLNKLSANNGEMSGHLYCVAKALCLLVAY